MAMSSQSTAERPLKKANVPKWKLESENIRRAVGRTNIDSRDQLFEVSRQGSSARAGDR